MPGDTSKICETLSFSVVTSFFFKISPIRRWVVGLSALVIALGVLWGYVPKPSDVAGEIAEFQEVGKVLKVSHFVALTMPWAVGGSLLVAFILLSLSKQWAKPLPSPPLNSEPMPRYLWIALLGIVLVGGGLRWNLAHQGFWWDELWQTKNATVGYYLDEPDQPLEERRFLEGSFERTFWQYRLPTNHPVASVPSRMMYLLTRDPDNPLEFDEFALRFPGLAAGLATIFLVGLLGWRVSGPRVALVAALILAIHPWHIRYSVDLRSYAWVMLWTTLAMLCLQRLARYRCADWKSIAGVGLAQFLLVFSSIQTVWLALAIFFTTCALAYRGWQTRSEKLTAVSRVVFAHVLAGMAFLMVSAPLIPQIYVFLQRYEDEHLLSLALFRELLHELFWGELDLEVASPVNPVLFFIGWGLLVFGIVRGVMWLSKQTISAPIVLVMFSGATLTLLFYSLGHAFFYTRFIVYLLPPLALAIACGWVHWESEKESSLGRYWMIPGLVGLGLYITITLPWTRALNTLPFEPLREIAEVLGDPEGFPIGYGHGVEVLPMYLPELRIARNRADLEQLLAEAKAAGKTPLLAVGHEDLNRVNAPDGYELIDDGTRFEGVERFEAIGKRYFYRVLRGK